MPIMDVINSTALRKNLTTVLDEVCDSAAPLIVTRQKARPVVLISLEEFRTMEETMHLTRNPANAERLTKSIAELEAGNFVARDTIEPGDSAGDHTLMPETP
jgi:antitoxin YefM